jgi:hypothetical protein
VDDVNLNSEGEKITMAKSKTETNQQENQKFGPVPHHKASDAHNAEMDRLKRDPNRVQKLMDRQ